MAEDVAAGENAGHAGADDRTLLDDLTVLAQPVGAAPQSGEVRQSQDSDRGGGINELAAIHQGTPDLAAHFTPAAPDQAGVKDGGDLAKGPDTGQGAAIGAIDNAKPVGPDNTPRADGSEGNSSLTLPQGDSGRPPGTALPAAPTVEDTVRRDPAPAPQAVAPAAAAAIADAAPVTEVVTETKVAPATVAVDVGTPATVGAPSITVTAARGEEDNVIALDIKVSTTDEGDALGNITIVGVPSGASLNHGVHNADGSWTLSRTDLDGLTLTPPTNFGGTIELTVNATASDSGLSASSAAILDVTVLRVADKPSVTASDAATAEDSAVPLAIAPHLVDLDGSEAITAVTITGVPVGATLNHGSHNADGSWTLTTADLAGLKITPASHDAHDFTLTITTTATEMASDPAAIAAGKGSAVSDAVTLHVAVAGVDQAPVITQTAAAAGVEDARIAVNLDLSTFKADESLTGLTITTQAGGDAANASALAGSAFTTGSGATVGSYDAASHTWSFSATEVQSIQTSGLYVQTPRDWDDYSSANHNTGLALTATLASREVDPDSGAVTTNSTPLNLAVHVAGVADIPTVTASAATTTEDTSVPLTIRTYLADTDGSEAISAVTITGVPAGATLNHGTHNADGSWTLSNADLAGLAITPASHDAHDFTLTITTTATELGGNVSVRDAISAPVSLHVAVAGVDQAPVITQTAAAAGVEDARIAVNLDLSTFKADESLTGLTITTQAGGDAANASALAGSAFTTGSGATVGSYDAASHTWSFSATEVQSIQASGLYVQTPRDWNDYVSANHTAGLGLTATLASREVDPDSGAVTTASTPLTLTVHVAGVADKPTVTVTAAEGNEDTAIPLAIAPHLTDITNTEAISAVTITGVPSGASLNHGTHNADGSWTLTTAQLSGLTITPPAHSNVDFTLTVTTTATELGGNVSVLNSVSDPVSLRVTVDGVAHAPVETVSASLSGNEDSRVAIDLNLATFKADESLTGLTIASQSGSTAANATALAGSAFTTGSGASVGSYDAAHGQWTFTADEVATIKAGGLYVQAPHDWSDWSSAGNNSGLKLTATVTASETDPDSHVVTTATTSQNTAVHFLGVADTPTVTTVDVAGSQNTGSGAASNWIALSITPHLADTDGSESISALTLTNLPSGAILNQGTHNPDGSWTVTNAQLTGLKILPAAHDAHDFTIYVTATSTETGPNVAAGLGSATSVQAPIHVTVEASAEAPVVTQSAASGREDTRINVNLGLSLNDAAESVTGLTLTGVTPNSHFYSAASGGVALGAESASGTWTFTTGEIATIKAGGLFVLPPTNWSDYDTTGHTAGMQFTAALSATKTDPDSGLVHDVTTTQALSVMVKAVADTPTAMTTSPAHGSEYDGSHADWIPLTISTPALTDTDGSETLSVTIAGVPTGGQLNHGSYNSTTKLWTVAATDLADLKVQPAAHDAKDFTLTITATATEGGVASHIATATASTSTTLVVSVDGVADTPILTHPSAASGNEDSRINLNLNAQLADSGEALTLTLGGVVTGSHFYSAASGGSAIGHDNGDGSWSFSATEMKSVSSTGLFIQPPTNWSDYATAGHTTGMQLTATLTSTQIDPDTNAVTTATANALSFGLVVKAVADAPTVVTVAASGHESDGITANWIPLSISTAPTDSDGSESITGVVIGGVPTGAQLQLADGTILSGSTSFTLTQAQLAGLKIQPATHDARDFTLTIASTSTEAGDAAHVATATATTNNTLKVTVSGVADTPTIVQTTAASGNEDTRIDLHLTPQLADAGESLTMTLTGVPSGSHFYTAASGGSAVGTDGGNGSWTFSKADMVAVKAAGLFVQPPTNWSDYSTADHVSGMSLTASLTSTQIDPDTNVATTAVAAPFTFGVEVKSVADVPTVTVTSAAVGQNDASTDGNWVALAITPAVTDTDGSEVISAITISGMPAGAQLNHGSDNGNGSWTLSSTDLAGLKILPPAHSASDFTLTVTATASEKGDDAHVAVRDAVSSSQTLRVTVTGQAEAPVLGQSTAAVGNEDSRINVNLSVVLPGAGETVTGMTMTNVPAGSVFYASEDGADSTKLGTYDAATRIWSFTSAEVATIQSAGHGLFIQPPKDWSDYDTTGHTTGMQLLTTISAREVDPDTNAVTTATTTQTLAVEVKAVADAPSVTASAAGGLEDTAIALTIAPHLADVDGSEAISALTITGVPTGAVLNHGHDNGGGSWTLTKADLTGLTITPPANSKTAFSLHVTATATEGGDAGHIAVASATSPVVDLKVTIDAVADTPTVTVAAASGNEDSWIPLSITATSPDAGEAVSVEITGVPSGAILNHGTYDAATHTWSVGQNDLADLKILPVKDDNSDFTLHVTGVTREPTNGSTAHAGPFDVTVTVTGTAEAPTFTETARAIGVEDTRINLNLTGSLTDGNEVLTLKLAGIPAGAHFFSSGAANLVNGSDTTSVGHDNGDGTWSFTTAEVAAIKAGGIFLQPPTDWSDWSGVGHSSNAWTEWNPGQGGIAVTATLTSTDTDVNTGAKTPSDTQISFTVHVSGVADAANGLPAGHFVASQLEDNGNTAKGALVDLGFGQLSLKDADGSEHLSVVVSNLPAGTSLEFANGVSAENIVPIAAGKWSIESQYLSSLRLRVGENVNSDVVGTLHLNADVVTTEVDGNVHVDSRIVDVTVTPVTDAARIGGGANGYEEAAIPLNLSVAAGGTAETVTNITLDLGGAIAAGAVVRYDGTVITADAGGHYTLSAAQMADPSKFTVTAPHDWSDWSSSGHNSGIAVGVSVTAHDHTAADLVTTKTLAVHVAGVADTPTLGALGAVTIGPNQATNVTTAAFDVASKAALADSDGSERLWMVVDGLPDGALLTTSAGALAGYSEGGGKWMVTADQWDTAVAGGGFKIVVPHGLADAASHAAITSATVTVTVLGTERDDGSTASSVQQSFTLTWDGTVDSGGGVGGVTDPVAPAVTLSGVNVTGGVDVGNEDSAIALNIAIPVHAGLTASVVIDAASLNGGTLSAGIYDPVHNTWTVPEGSIAGLSITPAHNWNSVQAGIDLSLSAKVVFVDTANGGTTSTALTIPVHVNPVTDTPNISGSGAGAEDTAISLNLADSVGAAGETITAVSLGGVPAGAQIIKADGSVLAPDVAGGSIYSITGLSSAELGGLKIIPPHNWSDYSGTISLDVAVTAQDHAAAAMTAHKTVTVHVSGVTDLADVGAGAVQGTENQWINLSTSLHAVLTDTDGSEGISLVLANVPAGAVLNHGFNNGDGSWRLDAADLPTLKILMPTDFNGQQTMTLKGLTWEKDGSDGLRTASADFTVTVDAAAGTPSVSVTSAKGYEDSGIPLSISASVVHALGTDHIDHVTIAGVPAGASLSAGTDNGDGSWSLTAAQLSGLTITPPPHSDVAFTLRVSATAAETDSISGQTSTVTSAAISLDVKVDAVANGGTVTVAAAHGSENGWIDLSGSISPHLIDTDGSEAVTGVVISGMPSGAVLNHGVHNADGSWTVAPADLASLKLLPAINDAHDFTLSAAAVSTEAANGASATGAATSFTVTVDAAAAPVALTQSAPAAGGEDTRINLNLSTLISDPNETATLTIGGVPSGSHFYDSASDGAAIGADNGNGTWTFSAANLAGMQAAGHGLYIVAPANWSDWNSSGHTAGMQLTATVNASVTDPDTQAVSTTSSTLGLTVHVEAAADGPVVTVGAARGNEDSWISLDVASALSDTTGSEYLTTVTISGVPTGASLNHGHDNGDGSWTLQQTDLAGLQIKPAPFNATDFTLSVTAESHDWQNADTATSAPVALTVEVDAVVNTPTVTVANAATTVDIPVALSISPHLVDSDGSESISAVTITGVPDGASLNHGSHNPDGSWTVTAADLADLTLTTAAQDARDLTLHVTATSTEAENNASATSASVDLHVAVTQLAHAPVLHAADVSGNEDASIDLHLTEALANAHETLSLTLSGVPANFSFVAEAGGAAIGTWDAAHSAWTFTAAELAQTQAAGHGLFVQAPANWSDWNTDGHAGLPVTATLASTTAVDPDTGLADTATTTASFTVHVDAVADAPNLLATSLVATAGATTPLSIASSLVDTDGSESLSLTITGLAADASLNHGTHNTDGSWSLSSADLSGLSVTTTANDAGVNTLHVAATSTEAGGSSTSTIADLVLKLNSADLGTVDDQHMLHFDALPPAPANGSQLAEFVYGSLDGIHSLDVTGINDNQHLGSFAFDAGNEHLAIAAGTHGFIDGEGLHTIGADGSVAVQHLDPAAFIDTTKIHGDLTFDNSVVLHVEGLDKITF